ncbi:apolipoprotein N-acyltransferase / mannosyltransferase [Pontimonas salivibrio]|uniref:Apolipoprotein N-acyltransferase n=1 Tax=Pontimonas salivibrio TaxID=1159327 RepID=A0A2L2BQU1_9MICO|nr:apolipoprotein N-acyltransferase [Pontimonas salivibrio]AVG23982.1 apolipoprotein N-acyltransferase / mannosyltransferase [Pontimonas salivibrio]
MSVVARTHAVTAWNGRGPLGLPLLVALTLAVVSGWVMDLGHPDTNLWPLTLVGAALMIFAARGLSVRSSLLVGAVGGFSYYGIHIWWLTVYLGPVPWFGLTIAQTAFFALGFALLTLAWRWIPQLWSGPVGTLGMLPTVLASIWLLRESVSGVWPSGGFNWARLAHSQSETPLTPLVAWVGPGVFSFILAWLSAFGVVLWLEHRVSRQSRAALALAVVTALVVWPAFPTTISGHMSVAAIQGNADAGLFAQYERGDNLRDHHLVTQRIYGEQVDVVVWPENASDIDPLRDEMAAAIANEVVREMDAPLVVGTITRDGDETFNSVLLWEEDGQGGSGASDQYDKIHPVPFAEYLPARELIYPLAPELFDLVPRDYSFGTRDTVFSIDSHTAGIAICYDIVDDAIFAQMMDEGADIIFAPTNNADFGRTDQSLQQLAIARLRAVELGRSVVNISTVGTSAIITPEGKDLDRLPTYTEGYMIERVPTATHTTPAARWGKQWEWWLIALGLSALAIAGSRRHSPVRASVRDAGLLNPPGR